MITCRMSGCSELRIVFRHIIPNILPHLLVLYSTGLSSIIIMISSYAFLGLGLETGTAEWGAMFVNANKLMFSHPQFLVYPGLCILFAAAGFNLFGRPCRTSAHRGRDSYADSYQSIHPYKADKGNPCALRSASP
ncbi:MAG: ABC transporter permease subunit [Oscillospiraceae bacterium]